VALAHAAPGEALPLARAILERKPWWRMQQCVDSALAQIDDPAAVKLALARERRDAVADSVCARAAPAVLSRLKASPVMNVTRRHPRDETFFVEGLLAFLGRHRVKAAWPAVARLYDSKDTEVRIYAGHALYDFGDARSAALLTAKASSDWTRFFAVKEHLRAGPAQALTALGGPEALARESQAALTAELLDQVYQQWSKTRRPLPAAYLGLALACSRSKRRPTRDVAEWVLSAFPKARVAATRKAGARRPARRSSRLR
jgi:hypothetical protein